jgi:hypothetical protein
MGRILTASPTLAGQLTNQARDEMKAFLTSGSTLGQLTAVVNLFRTDAQNKAQELGNEIDTVKNQIADRKSKLGKEVPRTTTPTYTPPGGAGAAPPAGSDPFAGFSIGP